MPDAHLYFFSDACPGDWLAEGQDDTWHTIGNFLFQSEKRIFDLVADFRFDLIILKVLEFKENNMVKHGINN